MKKDYIKDFEGAERRYFEPQITEIRAEDKGSGLVEGIAAVVGVETDMRWYNEKIERGAFDDVMNDDVAALFNHDPNFVLARSKEGKGTLELFLNNNGDLGYRYITPERSYARDLLDAIKSGDISKSSFAFTIESEEWVFATKENGMDMDLRIIKKLSRLFDVSPVTYPAYPSTDVAARSLKKHKPNHSGMRKRQLQLLKLMNT